MSVLTFPRKPRRYLAIEHLWGDFRAYYCGDLWTEEFQTEWHSSIADLQRELRNGPCQGLPLVHCTYDGEAVAW